MYYLIRTTTNSDKIAQAIAENIINSNLSSCVHIIPNIKSIYKWKEEYTNDKEHIIEIKSLEKYKNNIKNVILKHHNYETPEIICFEIDIMNKEYEQWINEQHR